MESEFCDVCKLPEKTVDECYNQIIKRLTEQGKIKEVSLQLKLLTTNHERVQYVYNVIQGLKFLPALRVNGKNDSIAVYYRNLGNEHFNHKRNFEAWQAYNLSLLYAVSKSENYIIAVSNRSAVFFSMQKYVECLEDIKYVFSTEFPEKIKNKLLNRREQCVAKLAALGPQNPTDEYDIKISETFRVKGPKDEKYLSASTKLKVVYTEEMGRHVIANEDIKVGEVLAQEEAYMSVVLEPQYLFCCDYCLSRNMNLFPCTSCVYTLYCSTECYENASKKYHAVECSLLPSVLGMEFSKMDLLALRALVRSRNDVSSWEELLQIVEEAESRVKTDLWGCVKIGNKWIYDSKYYSSIHTLATNVDKRSLSDLFRKSLNAALLMHFLSLINYVSKDDKLYNRISKYVSNTLLLHIMTSPTNMHGIGTNIANENGKEIEEYPIASGAYPFLSLLNHSCAQNVVRYSKLGSTLMSLIAIRPIKKGMQIFDNYGYHHAVLDREGRQSNLKFQYKFNCVCEACMDDWGLHAQLKQATFVPGEILLKKDLCLANEVIQLLMKGDKETAVVFYQPLCDLIQFYDAYAPCKELSECQEALKQCLAIFNGLVPHGYSKMLQFKALPSCQSTGVHLTQYISKPAI